MIDLDVQIDTRDAALFIRGIDLKAIPIAETRALNKVIVTVRKEAVSLIHNVRRLKKATIRGQLQLLKAKRGLPEARVRASRRPIPLKQYAAKWSGRKGNKSVVVNVTGQRKLLPHAFILDQIGGKAVGHVFERTGAGPLPLRKLFGPSLGSALISSNVSLALRRVVSARWGPVYTRELNFALSKLKR